MDWTKVVTDPLGLTGFALALVFGLLSVRGAAKLRWLRPAGVALAAIAIFAGLGLAYMRTVSGLSASQESAAATTAGNSSPAISGSTVQGGISVGAHARSEAPDTSPPPPRPARPEERDRARATTQGDCSPAIAGTQVAGGVTINCSAPGDSSQHPPQK